MTSHNIVGGAGHLLSIEPVTAPEGSEGTDWFRYRVGLDRTIITGFTRGSRSQVEREVADVVGRMNSRRTVVAARAKVTVPSAVRRSGAKSPNLT
jgi:hypothetical protein